MISSLAAQYLGRRGSPHHTKSLFFVSGALLALWSLFAPLPSLLLDLLGCIALAAGVNALSISPASLPAYLVSLAVFRAGLGLALLRGALSGDTNLTTSLGASLPGAAGVLLVASAALVLGLFLAKAAARAAEVAARFALDSLPGAQSAIDAEHTLASDPLQKNRAREALLNETRWRGSADGAAKLLSGDAILAPILGGLAVIAPVLQGQPLALSQGIGVALLLLASALPPAAALAVGVVSESNPQKISGLTLASISMLPLLLVPQASLLAPLLVLVGCAALFVWRPKAPETNELEILLPAALRRGWREANKLGFELPSMAERDTPETSATIQTPQKKIATASSIEELLQEAAPELFSLESAQQIVQKIRERSPVSASMIQAPLPVLYRAMRQLLLDRLPLQLPVLTQIFSETTPNTSPEDITDKLRQQLRPLLLKQLGAPPTAVLRLTGELEDELRRRSALDAERLSQMRAQQQELDESNQGRAIVVLCHRDARAALSGLLKRRGWFFFTPDELPFEAEIDFLGELGA